MNKNKLSEGEMVEEETVKNEEQDFEDAVKTEMDEIKHETEEIKAETDAIKEGVDQIQESLDEISSEKKDELKKKEDFKNKYYYLAAEMDNLIKRHGREKENLLKYGHEKILTSLVDIVDNLDRTLDVLTNETDEKIKNIFTGVDMVRNQFLDVLSKNGLEKINSLGETFNPNFHEVLSQQEAEGKKPNEIIIEYQKGYTLNGRLLRATKVVVAK